MGKREIDRKFDEIVAFAEVEKFIDTPVKHYSTGMYLRLAFAVAAHLEPDILLVDEVLLDKPGFLVATTHLIAPESWASPFLYIIAVLIVSVVLRSIALICNVWQSWQFAGIAKDIIYRMRCQLCPASATNSVGK